MMDLEKWFKANGVSFTALDDTPPVERKLKIIFKSGESITVTCREYDIYRRRFGGLALRKIEGITQCLPVYIRNSQVAAIVEE